MKLFIVVLERRNQARNPDQRAYVLKKGGHWGEFCDDSQEKDNWVAFEKRTDAARAADVWMQEIEKINPPNWHVIEVPYEF